MLKRTIPIPVFPQKLVRQLFNFQNHNKNFVVECQTELRWLEVEEKISLLETDLKERPEFSVSTVLEGNDKLTRFYTGMLSYESFIAFASYLEPKALHLQAWQGSETSDNRESSRERKSSCCFSSLSISNRLFTVLIRLRRGLESFDVCTRLNYKSITQSISEATYSRMFTTWIVYLCKKLRLLLPIPSKQQVLQWLPSCFNNFSNIRFSNTCIIVDCYEIECQRPSGLMNSSVTYSQYKSHNTWKILIGCTSAGLMSFVSEAWGGRISETGDMIMADKGFDILYI